MSVKKNIFYNVVLSILNFLFPVITTPYISRILGVENIGLVNFATNYVEYFVLFAALGINHYGVREIAKYKGNKEKISIIFSELFLLNSIATIIATICYFGSIYYISALHQDWEIFILIGFSLYLAPISIDWYFRGLENFKIITCRSIIIKFLSFFGLFLFVKQREDVIPYILLQVFSIIGAYILNFIYAKREGLKITWKKNNLSIHIKPMMVFFFSTISIRIFTMFGTIMLGFLSSYEQVGFFTAPNKILIVVTSFFDAINASLIPRLAFNWRQNNNGANHDLLQKIFDINSLLIIPSAVGLCLLSSHFVPLFFGNEFLGSILPMQILSFKVIVAMLNSFFGKNILMTFGCENKYLIVIFLTALLSFFFNLYLIPKYGAIGASVTSVVSECFQIGLNLFLVYKFVKIRFYWRNMFIALIFTLPFFVFYFLCNRICGSNIQFLIGFVVVSFSVYMVLQFFMAKNYLLMQISNQIAISLSKIKNIL
jgi:O-antigen/teichoic acid export membrane protein